jgi:hypothetical protein
MKVGDLYDIFGELCRIEAVRIEQREERVTLKVLAGDVNPTGYVLFGTTFQCTGIRPVGPGDTVLYIGKTYKSPEYFGLLKGE